MKLSVFIKTMNESLADFEVAYMKQHLAAPIQYPLELPDDMPGLWFEFFTHFIENSEA